MYSTLFNEHSIIKTLNTTFNTTHIQPAASVLVREREEVVEQVSRADIEQLFDGYDEDSIGFVTIGHIKERVKNHFALSEQVLYSFMTSIEHMKEDEMLNRVEFHRLWVMFVSPQILAK